MRCIMACIVLCMAARSPSADDGGKSIDTGLFGLSKDGLLNETDELISSADCLFADYEGLVYDTNA